MPPYVPPPSPFVGHRESLLERGALGGPIMQLLSGLWQLPMPYSNLCSLRGHHQFWERIMTPDDAIRAWLAAEYETTPGPWFYPADGTQQTGVCECGPTRVVWSASDQDTAELAEADATFIAASRAAAPAVSELLGEVADLMRKSIACADHEECNLCTLMRATLARLHTVLEEA